MTQLHDLTAVEQVEAIAAKQVSSRELTLHYLDRIDRLDDDIKAFVTVLADHALASADAADASAPTGLLHGLPLALKDLSPAAGLPTTFGSRALKDMVTPLDGAAIGNLRAAGAVVIGKTNAPEFGPTCYTENDLTGSTANPYDVTLSPSGSSGGAAAAVAAGMVGIAHGSDGLGSIRTPAAACGLVGFKTSRGRTAGSGAGWFALATEGPLARTVRDAALFLDAMGGPAASDLHHAPTTGGFERAARTPVGRKLRIGRLVTSTFEMEIHPDCLDGLAAGVAALEHAGHEVVEIAPEDVPVRPEVRAAILVVLSTSMTQIASLVGDSVDLLMPYTRWLIASNTYTSTDLAGAHATLHAAAMATRQLLDRYDLVISPTTTAPPQPTGALRADDGPGCLEAMARWSAFTPAANIAGTPAVSLPVHATKDGVPIGVQLMAPLFRDALHMSVAPELEPAFDWHLRHPSQW
jgi:amidase